MKFAASARLSANVERAKPVDPEIDRLLSQDKRSAAEAQIGTPEEEALVRAAAARAAVRASDARNSAAERLGVKK